VKAHAAAYHTIHELHPESLVGLAHHYRGFVPASPRNPLNRMVAATRAHFFNSMFPRACQDGRLRLPGRTIRIPQAAATQDFLGLNYYSTEQVVLDLRKPTEMFGRGEYRDDADLSATGFIANEPAGMWQALKWAQGFELPIYVTENGVEDPSDTLRPRYLCMHIHQVWRAVNFNWPVRGYFVWSLVDNFEWERGWTQRFGLYELDLDTQKRLKRPSADMYAEICARNALGIDTIALYAPRALNLIFPGSRASSLHEQSGRAA
jgi:beta-glucosidase